MNIAAAIRYMRQKRNLTQAELAAALNITPQAVSRWEMGISYPDIAMVPVISEVLQVSADELLGIRLTGTGQKIGQESQAPLNQSQVDSIFDFVPGPITGEPRRILVTDDSDYMRMALEDILTQQGHSVLQAGNGQECLDVLEREEADVCVLDIVMPVMDGTQALRRIREERPGLKVIMLSALSQESNVRLALELGADAFVVKPFQAKALLERIG